MINLCSIDCLSDPEIKLEFKEKRLILVVTAQDEEANTEQEHKFVFVLGKLEKLLETKKNSKLRVERKSKSNFLEKKVKIGSVSTFM